MKEKMNRFIQAFKMNGAVKKRTLTIGIPALVVVALAIVLLCLLPKKDKAPDVDENPVVEDEIIDEEPTVEMDPIVLPAEYTDELRAKYPDIYAWLVVPGTSAVLGTPEDLSYPMMQSAPKNDTQTRSQDFYLDHDLDGNPSKAGCIFSQYNWSSQDMSDPVHILYGHNMANRTMFGGLQSYMAQLKYDQDQLMYVYQAERRLTYRIFAGVQYSTDHILYYNDFNADGVMTQFINNLCQEKDGSTNINKNDLPTEGDRLLILSVCKNGDDNHRYLIIGKLVEDTDVTAPEDMTPAERAFFEAKLAEAGVDTAAKTDANKAS